MIEVHKLDMILQGLHPMPTPIEIDESIDTYEFLQSLGTLIKNVAKHCDENHDKIYDEFKTQFDTLVKSVEDRFNDVNLLHTILPTLEKFCTDKLSELIANSLKYITFELTDDGYFCAYIPDVWINEIMFDTNINPESEDYGKLIIEY